MDNPVFELNEVYFSYLGKFPALNGVNIQISPGQKISIVGANGSGKSTFLQLLDGLIFADQGTVNFYGQPLNEKYFSDAELSANFRRQVGFIFQNSDIQLFCPTVKEDIVFGPLQLGVPKAQIQKRLEKLSLALKIEKLLDRSPHQLSIGEKRKIAIASTLIIDPQVLILDEPTAGLDPLTTRSIIDLLTEEDCAAKTIITATHDLHIVEEISELIYVFGRQNSIVMSGPAESIVSNTRVLEENNLIHIHRHRHKDKVHAHPHLHSEHHTDEH